MLMHYNPDKIYTLWHRQGGAKYLFARLKVNDEMGSNLYCIPADAVVVVLKCDACFDRSFWSLVFYNNTICYLNECFMKDMLEIKC